MSVIVAASRKFGHAWWLVASTSAAGNCEGDAGRSWQDMQSVGVGRESPSDIGDGEGSTTERGTASARMSAPDSEACGKVAVVKSDGDNDGVSLPGYYLNCHCRQVNVSTLLLVLKPE
nr:uncharacterized protein LOC119169157 [Rhipicephalus microplus]